MPYLVDGHNLVPKAGLDLGQIDDERVLLARLQGFCRSRHARMEVFFDGAPPGAQRSWSQGSLTAYFIRRGTPADAAIEARLTALGRQARNWTVVSSDRRVQAAARAAHARVLSSEEFVLRLGPEAGGEDLPADEALLEGRELDEWLRLFDAK